MSPDKELRLREAFPALYRRAMPFGFECGDGWFDLLWTLSGALQAEAQSLGIAPESEDYPRAVQVKSKFASLCWYGENLSEKMQTSIQLASEHSRRCCETCGAPGRLWVRRRWYLICCDAHAPSDGQLVEER